MLVLPSSVIASSITPEELKSYETSFNFSADVHFSPGDINLRATPTRINNSTDIIFPMTVEKTVWRGGSPLVMGYPFPNNVRGSRSYVNYTLSINVTNLIGKNVNLTVVHKIHADNFPESSNTMSNIIINSNISRTYKNQTIYSVYRNGVYTGYNSTYSIPEYGYYNFLRSQTTLMYSTLSMYLTSTSKSDWNSSVSISFNLKGIHNPKLYELDLQRLHNLRNNRSTVTNLTSNPGLATKIQFTPLYISVMFMTVFILTVVIKFKRKQL